MKKKLLTMLLTGCMVLSLAACGNNDAENQTEQTQQEGTAEESEESTVDDNSALGTSTLTKLGEYKGLTYTPADITVTDEEVETEVQYMLSSSFTKDPKEIVSETSYVNIDYVGKKDGVAFDGGTASGQQLSIQNSGYIEGFAESIVGMKVGETKDCPMTFPENYHAADLAGQDVVFTITVNECWEQLPAELNDEFAVDNGYESVDAMYAGIRAEREKAKLQDADYDKEYQLISQIIENSTFDINDAEVQLYADQMISQYEGMAYNYYGVDLETYVASALGMSMEDYEANCRESAVFQIQQTLVKKAVAEAESLEITDEDYNERVQEYMAYYGYTDVTEFETAVGVDSIKEQVLLDKAVEFIVENGAAGE